MLEEETHYNVLYVQSPSVLGGRGHLKGNGQLEAIMIARHSERLLTAETPDEEETQTPSASRNLLQFKHHFDPFII